MNAIWFLIFVATYNSTPVQFGPFASAQQCEAARATFVAARSSGYGDIPSQSENYAKFLQRTTFCVVGVSR